MWRLLPGSPSDATRSQRNLPGALVDRVEHPLVPRPIVGCIAVAVETGLERRVRSAADGARHEDAIAPDDRARVREARESACARGCSRPSCRSIDRGDSARRRRRTRCGPRNDGQLPLFGAAAGSFGAGSAAVRTISRLGMTGVSPSGSHVLSWTIMRRASHSSAISESMKLRAIESETIATGTIAVAHARGEQRQLVVGHLPGAVERRPALTFEREGSVSGKLEREETVVQRFRGKHGGSLLRVDDDGRQQQDRNALCHRRSYQRQSHGGMLTLMPA